MRVPGAGTLSTHSTTEVQNTHRERIEYTMQMNYQRTVMCRWTGALRAAAAPSVPAKCSQRNFSVFVSGKKYCGPPVDVIEDDRKTSARILCGLRLTNV